MQTIRRLTTLLALALTSASTVAAPAASKIEPALQAAAAAGRTEFVVYLADKADLSAVASAKTKAAKGEAVVAALKATASRSQSGVNALLDARGLARKNYWVANVITSQGSLADIELLAARSDVAGLHLVHSSLNPLSPYIARRHAAVETAQKKAEAENYAAKALAVAEPGVELVNAPAVWALGFTGAGVVVGDHDIGVQWDHPALKKKYRGWNEATQTASHAYNWFNAFGMTDAFCSDPATPCDPNEHGTHTTGSMVGDDGMGNRIGVSPGSSWMACRSLLDPFAGAGTVPAYLDCMEWLIAPYPTGNTAAADATKAPDVVNNSWGCIEGCAPPVLQDVNEATLAAGIMQVVSAGNDGTGDETGCSTLAFPLSVYESSFTVGANDKDSDMADFTSLGPVASDGSLRIKPNITGPGVSVRSSIPGNDYGSLSGTSMSGPHVAGVAALVMSSEPRLIGRVMDVRTLLERTANPIVKVNNTAATCGGTAAADIPNNIFGYGQVDALAAVLARPMLQVEVKAPATVIGDNSYTAMLSVSQPASGKIDVTNAEVDVTMSAAATFVSATPPPASNTVSGGVRTLHFSFAKLEPGQTEKVAIVAARGSLNEITLTPTGEADQVSPVSGAAAKTVQVIGINPTPNVPDNTLPVVLPAPVATAASAAGGGRFGGALGGMAVLLLGLGAVVRRVRR